MRKLLSLFTVMMLAIGVTFVARAADDEEKTIEGMAQCAKCALKEEKDCANVVVVKKDDKTTKYYLVMNEVAKKAHQSAGFCAAKPDKGPKVKVVGTVEEKDGKMLVTATKIEPVEE
jgi:hypothetical protein